MAKAVQPPIPPEGVAAIKQLLQFGKEKIERLGQLIQDHGPTFAGADIRARLLSKAGGDIASAEQLESILTNALLPLQFIRYKFRIPAAEFYDLVSEWLNQIAPEEWPQEYAEKWVNFKQAIIELFELTAFSVESKARALLEDRANWVQTLTIHADMRPVFNETAETLQAMLIVNSLCIQYRYGKRSKTAYFALDPADLDELEKQIELAKKANLRLLQQLDRDKIPALMLEHPDVSSSGGGEKTP